MKFGSETEAQEYLIGVVGQTRVVSDTSDGYITAITDLEAQHPSKARSLRLMDMFVMFYQSFPAEYERWIATRR